MMSDLRTDASRVKARSHTLTSMPTRVLVVSPAFHGIWRSVADALEQRGFEVEHHLYDENADMLAKVRHHATIELPSRLGFATEARIAKRLGGAARAAVLNLKPDAVLTIKGDLLGDEYWESLARIPHATWLYDQLDAMSFTHERWSTLGGIGSFSHSDTARLSLAGCSAAYVALAYDPTFEPGSQRTGGVVFAGARYPQREQLLLAVQEAGVPLTVFGRSWSKHPFDRVRTWDFRRPDDPERPSSKGVMRTKSCEQLTPPSTSMALRTGSRSGLSRPEALVHFISSIGLMLHSSTSLEARCLSTTGSTSS